MRKIDIFTVGLVTGLLGAVLSAHAGNVNVQTHQAVANSHYVMSESAASEGPDRYFLGAGYNWLNDPLVQLNPERTYRMRTLIDGIQTIDLTAGREIGEWFSLNATVPMNYVHEVDGSRAMALGDSRLFAKVYILPRALPLDIALVPELRLPTGEKKYFLTDGNPGYGLTLAVEKDFGLFRVATNLGYRRVNGAIFREMDYRNRIPMSASLSVPITQKLALNGEAIGVATLPVNWKQNPGELYAGGRYALTQSVVATAGASLGTTNSYSSADYRVLASISFQPFASREIAASVPPQPQAARAAAIDQVIHFKHDSAEILPAAKPALHAVVETIRENPARFKLIEVEGHCNEIGSDTYNMKLGARRANAVHDFLVSEGVDARMLKPVSYGESRPVGDRADFAWKEWLRVNRRVQFNVTEAEMP